MLCVFGVFVLYNNGNDNRTPKWQVLPNIFFTWRKCKNIGYDRLVHLFKMFFFSDGLWLTCLKSSLQLLWHLLIIIQWGCQWDTNPLKKKRDDKALCKDKKNLERRHFGKHIGDEDICGQLCSRAKSVKGRGGDLAKEMKKHQFEPFLFKETHNKRFNASPTFAVVHFVRSHKDVAVSTLCSVAFASV